LSKDNIFAGQDSPTEFRFNRQVAEVFDDMLNRSVPFYREVVRMTGQLLATFARPGDTVYDLGCSTGTTMVELARLPMAAGLSFVGVDNSPAMVEKARRKAEMYAGTDNCRFMEGDITTMELPAAGVIILNYTMQFIEPTIRAAFLGKLYQALRPGGLLIMSEKLRNQDPEICRRFGEFHAAFKKGQGYSDLEISRKREALENVLIPLTLDENRALLRAAGFTTVEPFFQWFNFASLLAIKDRTPHGPA